MPLYYMEDPSTRNRAIKYTPEHMHCMATFYGPTTMPNTGFLAFQRLGRDTPDFRISATGVVVDVDRNVQVFCFVFFFFLCLFVFCFFFVFIHIHSI